ncbi:MAG TPA: phosphate uptake regulator PhoU [Thermoplasmata archaeon]|jgi:phosphate uptake regulator|nr:phosphate uptake regulator PhoU [Thermoplasmata archaeon]
MELESRKVQKLGYSSLGVSVPKAWAESNGIRPGTVVNMVVEDDGSLRVRVGPLEEYPSPAEATVDADAWTGPESLTRLITGNYIVGCNTIRIRSREELAPGRLQEIHEAVRGLTGLTIVNQGPRFVTIENFVEPTRFPIDGLLRRLHYLTSRMEKLVLGVLAGESGGRIDEVGRMEVEVDRLYWLVVRQLLLGAQNRSIAARIGVTEPRHLLGDRVVSVSLENLGDLWEELAVEIAGEHRRRAPSKALVKTVAVLKAKLEKIIDLSMTSFFATDLRKANESLDLHAALLAELDRLGSDGAGSAPRSRQAGPPNRLLSSVIRTTEHASKYYATIAQITLNRGLESPLRPRVPAATPVEEPYPEPGKT